jgi:hypothetical protein
MMNAPEALVSHSCTADAAGVWSFRGTLRNSTEKTKTYTAAVAVTLGAAMLGHTVVTRKLGPGQQAGISAPKLAKSKDKNAVCEPVISMEDAR